MTSQKDRSAGVDLGGSRKGSSPSALDGSQTPEQLQRELAEIRAELGDTLEALAAKFDVRARLRRPLVRAKGQTTQAKIVAATIVLAVAAAVAAILVTRHQGRNR
jgi:hypothetical protein